MTLQFVQINKTDKSIMNVFINEYILSCNFQKMFSAVFQMDN